MTRLIVLAVVAVLLQGVAIQAQEGYNPVGLRWDPNSESDLAGYKIYEKTASGAYEELAICVAPTTEVMFGPATPHPDGGYCWVATAYDVAGNESGYSDEVCAIFDAGAPAAPTGCVTIP